MPRSLKSANPFYGLLVVAGIVFVLTTTVYVVMAFREVKSAEAADAVEAEDHPLMLWMKQHGEKTLLVEVAVLAVGTVGAIATDDYWQRRANRQRS